MNKNDLIRLRTKIITMLADLETTTETVRAALKESSEVTPNFLTDECDSAKAELDLKNALEVHKHSTAQKGLLRHALARMEGGSYGTCQCCEEDIGLPRLEAMPGASLCIGCQKERELGYMPEPRPASTMPRRLVREAA